MSLEKKQIRAVSFLSATRSVVPVLLVFWIIGSAQALDSFEADVSGWHADGGNIQRSEEHWKLGKGSLRWDFAPGAALTRARDAAQDDALKSSGGGIKLWFYCPKRIDGELQVQVGPWVFPVKLDFSGWRAVWVNFRDDARQATAPIDGLQISAPGVTASLFLDAVEFGRSPWFRQGDAQAPYTNTIRAGGKYWFTPHDHSLVPPPAHKREPTADDTRAFREIERRYEEWMFGHLDDPRAPMRQRVEAVKAYIGLGNMAFDHLALVRHDNVVSGPGVFCSEDEHGPHLADVFEPVGLPLAYDARLNDSDRARRRFLDLLDYAHDQGWAPGSLMGSAYMEPLGISGYVHGVYIMRQFLKEEGVLNRELETLRYHLGVGEIYRGPDHPGANADDLRTLLLYRLLYVLMLEDSPEKVRDMECFVRWANIALAVAPGYGDTIKPDGTVFHHATAYANAYGNNALLMSSLVYRLLSGTRFALSPQVGENIKLALLTLRFMAGQYGFPMGASGRWPFLESVHNPMVETAPALAYMADALNDKELGAAFARLWNPASPVIQRSFASCQAGIYWCDSPGALPWLLDAEVRYLPEPHPQGHRAYPFAAMNFHRRRQWVTSVRGWSQYVWNYEGMPGQNLFGRYSSYGTVQIFGRGDPVGGEESGYCEEGWDWLRPPGATVIRVPLDDLRNSKVAARSYTRDPFVGGVALEGNNGLWAMRFTDPCYEPSFCFRKSVFFVGETIVCLASGITNSDAGHLTETVLYQTALKNRPQPFPHSDELQARWLMDPVGNGYYFPEAQSVQIRTQHQQSIDNGGRRETGGDFAVAWLDHGRAPKSSGYAYAIRPDTNAQAMRAFVAAPNFQVLRRDDAAHVICFPSSRIVGYTLFGAVEGLAFDSLNGANAPCLVMTRHDGDRLVLAVGDPDLRLGERKPAEKNMNQSYQPGGEGRLRLRLNGAWRIEVGLANVRAIDDHTLEIVCRDGATYEVVLKQQ